MSFVGRLTIMGKDGKSAFGRLGLQALVVAGLIAGAGAQTPPQVTLVAKLRDFREFNNLPPNNVNTHPDFETMASCGDTGYVLPDIAVDRPSDPAFPNDNRGPVFSGKFNSSSGVPCFSNPSRFEDWYNDKDTATNRPFLTDLVFTRNAAGLYEYLNPNFFPLDNNGPYRKIHPADADPFGHLQSGNTGGVDLSTHNYGFTMEFHATFTYLPDSGQTFNFSGDDDVWVFINGKRVIDLGGRHGRLPGSVNLDAEAARLGLVGYENYTLDFFFAERHTSASFCQITTSLVFDKILPRPKITPGSTYFSGEISVTLSNPVPGAKLCYTLNGIDPDSAACAPVAGPVTLKLTETTTVKVIALRDGWKKSDVASATFTKMDKLPTPVANPPGGNFEGTQTVALAVPGVPDAVIRYTLDGSDPTESSPVYTAPLKIDKTATLKAKAFKQNFLPSLPLTETYTALLQNQVTIWVKEINKAPPPLMTDYPEAVAENPFAAVAVSRSGSTDCLNCSEETKPYYVGDAGLPLPEWSVKTKYGFTYSFQIYDNLGEFVRKTKGEITEGMLANVRKDAEGFRTVSFRWFPLSDKKTQAGTGAYILKAAITSQTSQGGQVLKSAETTMLITFGYLRSK